MTAISSLKTALVHHWLVTMRGGERVLEALAELFPRADIFTLVCDRAQMEPVFPRHRIRTSFLQHLPRAARWYRHYLPLFPLAAERLDLSGYQLVITSDAATLKGVRTDPGAMHICYCHTPMRYVWSGYETYCRAAGLLGRLALRAIASRLRRWDYQAAQGVTHFVANSQNVAERIRRFYGRESTVIYPPVDTEGFVPAPSAGRSEGFFLVVSQLVPYKRVELAVEAFNRRGASLWVIGDGSERHKLQRRARSNIRFLGSQPAEVLRQAMQRCRALVFPGEEDFGIVMAEAQACGKPVIAFARGGANEIVTDGVTGILFEEQTIESLLDGLDRCEESRFDPAAIRASALRFTRSRFLRGFSRFLENAFDSHQTTTRRGLPLSEAAALASPSAR